MTLFLIHHNTSNQALCLRMDDGLLHALFVVILQKNQGGGMCDAKDEYLCDVWINGLCHKISSLLIHKEQLKSMNWNMKLWQVLKTILMSEYSILIKFLNSLVIA